MNAICTEAPGATPETAQRPFIFLAGGISGCADWQSEMASILTACLPVGTVFNPRRAHYDMQNEWAAEEQNAWEFGRLWDADIVSFWFSHETLNPITLFEYGAQLVRAQFSKNSAHRVRLCVGIEPGYMRALDIRAQTKFYDPRIRIVDSLADLTAGVLMQVEQGGWNRNERRKSTHGRNASAVRQSR